MGRPSTGRWVWLSATLIAVLGILATPIEVFVQATYEVTSLGRDGERGVDRYRIDIRAGASFWEIGVNRLPLIALEQGDLKAVEPIEQAWRAQYPERASSEPRPDDTFVLEVPAGTFVAKNYNRQEDRYTYEAFLGDRLTTFPRDSLIAYRLQRAETPDRAEVLINGGPSNPLDEAKRVYDVDPPDFLQVRTVRGALQERTTRLTVDLSRKYLDDFRNARERAVRVEDLPDRLKAYSFDRDAADIPFVRVEDGVGDETDPGNFPRLFRVAYYRDGTVRRYLVTETGDSLGNLTRPDNATWSKILPTYQEWLPGQAEALPPFAPAISAAGALLPGRTLVVAFRPRTVQATPRPTRSASGSSGLDCAGLPLGLLLAAGVVISHRRPS